MLSAQSRQASQGISDTCAFQFRYSRLGSKYARNVGFAYVLTLGVCGKTPEVAALQDLLIYSVKGLGSLAHIARQAGIEDADVNTFINGAIFSTLTNVNFNDQRFVDFVSHALFPGMGQVIQCYTGVGQVWKAWPGGQFCAAVHHCPAHVLPSTNSCAAPYVHLLQVNESRALHARLASRMAAAGVSLPAGATAHQPFFGSMPHPLAWNSQAVAMGGVGDMIDIGKQVRPRPLVPLITPSNPCNPTHPALAAQSAAFHPASPAS